MRRKFSSFSSFSMLRSPCTVRVLLSMRTSMSFSSMPGTKLQSNVVLVFVDVHRRCEAGGGQRVFRDFGVIRLTEKTIHAVHAVLHGGKLAERFPTGQ